MQTLHTTAVTNPDALRGLGRLAYYNGLDCLLTMEIQRKLEEQLTPDTLATYRFMLNLQGPVLDMMTRGTPIDMVARNRMITILEAQVIKLSQILNRYTEPLWGTGLNAGSPQQKVAFLYKFLNNEPIQLYDRTTGTMRVTTNRDALEKLKTRDLRAIPIINAILAYQDCRKALSILRSGVDSDDRMRSSYNVAGTETGRLASRKNVFGGGSNDQNWREAWRVIFASDKGPIPSRSKYRIPDEYKNLPPVED